MCKKKVEEPVYFKYRDTKDIKFRKNPEFNINTMYQRVFEELAAQQTKRDQLITIYLAAFAFIVPALLSAEKLGLQYKGIIFIGLGLIGFLFSLIIIRYRKYKEVYWVCCRALNVMMTLSQEDWTKENIQKIFYACLQKRAKKYIENNKFNMWKFVTKNIFSGETLYLIINAFISSGVLGLGLGIILPFAMWIKIVSGIALGLVALILSVAIYFITLKNIYNVCVDGLETSFNSTFNDAWFLHFFI